MPLPRPREARGYYRAAKQRYDDAVLLLAAGRTTGAVYLAGYTVECMLKALVLAGVAARLRQELLGLFRGSRGHDIEWLGTLYRRHVNSTIPVAVTRRLYRVTAWSTDLRYVGSVVRRSEAREFMAAVDAIAAWADGRM
jgi:HEPN domain-containing protein